MNPARTPALAATSLLLALCACAGNPPSGGATPNTRLLNTVTVLEKDARVLAQRADGIDRGFATDAHEFLKLASTMREGVARGRAKDELQGEFDALTDSYQSLQSDAKTLDVMQADSAIRLVSGAYDDLASQMNAPRSSL